MQPALIVRARRTVQSRHRRLPASGSPLGNSNSPCAPPPSTVHCSPDVADERAVFIASACSRSVGWFHSYTGAARELRQFRATCYEMRCLGETRRLWPRACLDYRQPNATWRARRLLCVTTSRMACTPCGTVNTTSRGAGGRGGRRALCGPLRRSKAHRCKGYRRARAPRPASATWLVAAPHPATPTPRFAHLVMHTSIRVPQTA